jgi:hypothetical protein
MRVKIVLLADKIATLQEQFSKGNELQKRIMDNFNKL